MEPPQYFQYRRQIQSRQGQLDSHQHHQRAYCTIRSHCSLDRQRNDGLGWIQRQLFEQRRKILRGCTKSHTHGNTYRDSCCNLDTHSNTYRDS